MRTAENSPEGTGASGSYLSRVLGEGESPLWWGFPCGSLGPVRLRVHLVLPTFVLARGAYSLWSGEGPEYVGAAMLGLMLVVALHEAARFAASRRRDRRDAGTEACFWPLGAVWRSGGEVDLVSERRGALGALLATAVLAVALAAAVAAATGDPAKVLFNPLRPSVTLSELSAGSTAGALALILLWQTYAMAVYLLAANALPMLPLDGGLLLRARLARTHGIPRATERAGRIGLAVAFLLFVAALVAQATTLAALAACCGAVCWLERQSSLFSLDPVRLDRWREVLDAPPETGSEEPPITGDEREELEAVLEKISASGLGSLSRAERRLLRRATDKLRGG